MLSEGSKGRQHLLCVRAKSASPRNLSGWGCFSKLRAPLVSGRIRGVSFQVVIRSLEDHLALDFTCVCLYDQPTNKLTVSSVGVRSKALALELAMTEQSCIDVDQNGLQRSASDATGGHATRTTAR